MATDRTFAVTAKEVRAQGLELPECVPDDILVHVRLEPACDVQFGTLFHIRVPMHFCGPWRCTFIDGDADEHGI